MVVLGLEVRDGSCYSPRICRLSHIFAVAHSRLTVAGEMSRTSRDLLDGQAGEEPHLHDLGLARVEFRQLRQRSRAARARPP